MDINKLVMRLTGTDSWNDGQYGPPEAEPFRYRTANQRIIPLARTAKEFRQLYPLMAKDDGYQIWTSNNDGFELWMGWDKQWDHHLNQYEVRALFWYILIEWFMKARWFGLRRPLYYWALKRHVQQFKTISK